MTENQFEGMSEAACCFDCNIDGCVISGKPYCAHPRKGGLHSPEQQNPEALQRYRRAVATLERSVAEAKLKRANAALGE
ncbi:MAG: hypothetical protein ABI407_11450 [Bradyrhizobium sp.]